MAMPRTLPACAASTAARVRTLPIPARVCYAPHTLASIGAKVGSGRTRLPCQAAGTTARPISYRESGVDIDAGNALVEAIKPLARSTRRAGADADLGGFGALFDLKAAGFNDPILVAANDGVGTKLKIAIDTGRHATIGIDLVAMCVNDLLAQGAEPLFFLDYFACGKLDVETARAVVAGIAEGCRQAGCALIGGETAEMPGMYAGERLRPRRLCRRRRGARPDPAARRCRRPATC